MKAVGIFLAAWAYTFGTWGYILVKGYNITLVEWITPLHPYNGPWPPKCVPPGYIFPTNASPGVDCKQQAPTGTGSNDPNVKRAQRAAKQSGRTGTGTVQGRL